MESPGDDQGFCIHERSNDQVKAVGGMQYEAKHRQFMIQLSKMEHQGLMAHFQPQKDEKVSTESTAARVHQASPQEPNEWNWWTRLPSVGIPCLQKLCFISFKEKC